MTVRDRTANAAIGAVIQNVEILSPSSLGQTDGCQLKVCVSLGQCSSSGVRVLLDISDGGVEQVQGRIQKVQQSRLPSKRATHSHSIIRVGCELANTSDGS